MRSIPFGRPLIGDEEKAAVLEVLSGPVLVHGPRAKEFENHFAEYTKAPHAVSASSCTAAMHLAYLAWGLGPGDEVIVPAQTHCATAHAVEFTGARPVFVDADPLTGNIDLQALEAAITERTRAVAVVHFLGLPVDMGPVLALAARRGLKVMEDCALSVGGWSQGVHTGLAGDAGCFSFYPVKHMTTAEGGMLITRDGDLAALTARQKAFGVDRTVFERAIPGVYDVTMLGYNYRMSEVHAAIGIAQLRRIDGFLAARRENYDALRAGLAEVAELTVLAPDEPQGVRSSRYCLSVLLEEKALSPRRFEFVEALKRQGVGTSVYYPRPVPHLAYYRAKYGYTEREFPSAARISYGTVALSVGPHLNIEDMSYTVAAVKNAVMEVLR